MDDECKDYRKNKPQQKLYKPGSGPLRRSRYALDARMDSFDVEEISKSKARSHYSSMNSVNGESDTYKDQMVSNRFRKPEQKIYQARSGDSHHEVDRQMKSVKSDNSSQYNNRHTTSRQDNHSRNGTGSNYKGSLRKEVHNKDSVTNDVNFNRQYNQNSASRSTSPARSIHGMNSLERNRDSRSMETWAGRHKSHSGGKPPSGRRNSAGFSTESRHKHVVNLDNIPPRFRKKYLEQSGYHSNESIDQFNRGQHDISQSEYRSGQPYSSNWSQTLPSRGRGRLRDHEHFDREKFINSYLKSYDVQNSHRSTPSSSYSNLYEPNDVENRSFQKQDDIQYSDVEIDRHESGVKNGMTKNQDPDVSKIEKEQSKETFTSLSDMTNLDWTEEVEKNIKLDEIEETSTSFSSLTIKPQQEMKPADSKDPKKKSRRRDRRSSSRGHRNSERKDRNRKDSNASIQIEYERNRKDSNASIQYDINVMGPKHRDRERRDSHRSNRSSTIGNSRDDLDRWRSLRSYSREQSTERKIVSQCNSRDTSVNRALSPRDNEGFRVPSVAPRSGNWNSANQKRHEGWSGRPPSVERRRHSPTPSVASVEPGGEGAEAAGAAGAGGAAGGGRKSRKRAGRKRGRVAESVPPSPHPPGATPAPTNTNWREEILEAKKHQGPERTSENSHQRNRLNSVLSDKSITEASSSQPGVIVLPQGSTTHLQKDQTRGGTCENQKTLYDYHNPSKPIIVQTGSSKPDIRMERGVRESASRGAGGGGGAAGAGGAAGEGGEAARAARHLALLQQVDRADAILKTHTMRGPMALGANWSDVAETRKFLQSALQRLLMSDLKFCQADNIEQQFWKILYYHFIETLRKSITQVSPEEKAVIVKLINVVIDEGNTFFENLIQVLEKTYKFNTEDYLNDNNALPPKGLGYVGLAMVSVQKLYVFLGDLARYKEQVNETNNYAKSKFWYTKAQQMNPKNGRPYNQLAILAIYARRKLDAVYYYMRSLMSSNPFQSARESLLSLFEENRKKYEAAERKRRAVFECKSTESGGESGSGRRREVWVRPGARGTLQHDYDSMTPVELNKNFITAYLHVHGKLITKIGMETFHESAMQMLGQFRALLHRQPLPTPAARLLQLTALNMFAVESNVACLKGSENAERSAWLECALGVSLLMFGALLERCCALLPEPHHSQQHTDALSLLPAIKVWSDWMLCHSSVWNPPPPLHSFGIESGNDPWDWLAKLMNILESFDEKSLKLESEMKEGHVMVRLAEDSSLAGFTPLMYMEPAVAWARADPPLPLHAAEHALRTRKLLFFGTEYLVGVEPPVLKLEYPAGAQPRYVSAVRHAQVDYPQLQHLTEDSEDEDSAGGTANGPANHSEGIDEVTKRLLRRKELLESRKATLEKRRQRMQEMLGNGSAAGEVEVRPRWLVPDTNCFIDHLPQLQAVVAPTQPYQIAVPLVVMSELEGLCRCSRLGEAARCALAWVNAGGSGGAGGAGGSGGSGGAGGARGVRLVTARGSVLNSRTFTAENHQPGHSNDDRVLDTAINLQANIASEQDTKEENSDTKSPRRVFEVVLLTDDRNLRVKALAAELPARDLPSFMQWAGIVCDDTKAEISTSIVNPAPSDSK